MEEGTVYHVQEMDTDPQLIPQYMVEMYSDRRENLAESESESFREILLKYGDTLYDSTGEPGPPRQTPLFKRQAIYDEIKKLEDKKLIEKSNSPCSSGLVLVQKKYLSWRLCVDYRKLNDKTIKDSYPIPRIENNIDALSGAKWMSVLELCMAYQVHMNPYKKGTRKKLHLLRSEVVYINMLRCHFDCATQELGVKELLRQQCEDCSGMF
ncbi:unnamed protein product [Mytilus edulis]|uniref:Uncharacterized protein n=1 Tax=Mytilus edulis TaxID=6550 RepID=A0A8S3UK40_MYTED|nr:unnamed protein product [Mytilus edulis]